MISINKLLNSAVQFVKDVDFDDFTSAASAVSAGIGAGAIVYVSNKLGVFGDYFSDARARPRVQSRSVFKYSDMSPKTSVSDLERRLERKFFEQTTDSIIRQRTNNISSDIIERFERAPEGSPERRRISGDLQIRESYLDRFKNFLNKTLPVLRPKYRIPKDVAKIGSKLQGQTAGITDPSRKPNPPSLPPGAHGPPSPGQTVYETEPNKRVRDARDRISQQLRVDSNSAQYKEYMAQLDDLKGQLEDRVTKTNSKLDPNSQTGLLSPEKEAKLRRELALANDKKQFIEDFIERVKEFAEKSKGRSVTGKVAREAGEEAFRKIGALARYIGRRAANIKILNNPITKLGLTAITVAATLSMTQRAKMYLGALGDGFVAGIFEALSYVPFLDEWAMTYLEEEALEAQKKLKAARFVKEKAGLTDLQEIIIYSMEDYMKNNLKAMKNAQQKMNVIKSDRKDFTPPASPRSPTQAKQSVLDLMESSTNKKLKVTLGTINESKKPSNNKVLKIIIS